jgi:hypothetical protein
VHEADVLDSQFNERLRSRVLLSIEITDFCLVLGAGTRLARMVPGQQCISHVAHGKEQERLFALLSVAQRQPISANKLHGIAAALDDWERGEKALAHIRLAQASLPHIDDIDDAYRLFLAETLLDQGMAPRMLMKALGLDASLLDLIKYDPISHAFRQGMAATAGGTMIEAKGPPFGEMLRYKFFQDRFAYEWTYQASREISASGGRPLEWFFADADAADFARKLFGKTGSLSRIIVIHVPADMP